jgi:hypothetical protein
LISTFVIKAGSALLVTTVSVIFYNTSFTI